MVIGVTLFIFSNNPSHFPQIYFLYVKKIIGYALAGICSNKYNGWVLSVAVSKKQRNKRIGYKMMKRLIKRLRKIGIQSLKLTVHPKKYNAIKLYKNCGFVFVKKINNYFKSEPRILMKLYL